MATVKPREWTSPDGTKKRRWEVRYVAPDGTRPAKLFEKKKEADAYLDKIKRELFEGVHVAAAQTMTVSACCKAFLEHAERRREAGQIGRSRMYIYGNAINLHIIPDLGAIKLKDLTWADLEVWQSKLHKLSPRSREAYLTVLKMVEDYAIKRGHMKKPVVREFRRDSGSAKVAPIRTFSAEQAALLLRTVAERPFGKSKRGHAMLVCAVYLAACCGLRFGEIMGLTLASLDFDHGVLRVRHNLTAWDELKGPKTSSGRRDIPLPEPVARLLRGWLGTYHVDNDRGLLFRATNGKPIKSTNMLVAYWWPLLKEAGLWNDDGNQFHFHALRHFAASWMIEHGLALPDVASLMGHAKFDMTLQVYAHPIVGGHRRHDAFARMTGALIEAARLPPTSDMTQG